MGEKYQQVAALVCLDLDVLLEVSQDTTLTANQLREHIKMTHDMKEEIIVDEDLRKTRYATACVLFNLGVDDG